MSSSNKSSIPSIYKMENKSDVDDDESRATMRVSMLAGRVQPNPVEKENQAVGSCLSPGVFD